MVLMSLCYLGDESVVVAVQGARQDVSDEEVWVFAASLLKVIAGDIYLYVCRGLDFRPTSEV